MDQNTKAEPNDVSDDALDFVIGGGAAPSAQLVIADIPRTSAAKGKNGIMYDRDIGGCVSVAEGQADGGYCVDHDPHRR